MQVIKAILEGKEPAQFLLVLSEDLIRRTRFVDRYLETFAGSSSNGDDITSFDCSQFDPQMLIDLRETVQSLSLFSVRQFAVLRNVDLLKAADAKEVLKIFSNASPANCIGATGSKLPHSSTLYKFFEKGGSIASFEELKGFDLKRWAGRECAKNGITKCSEKALELLLDMAQGDLDYLVSLIELSALYVEDGTLSEREVGELFRITSSHSEFALVDEIFYGNCLKAKLLLSELLSEGKNAFGLMGIITRNYSQVLTARLELDRGHSETAVRDLLKVSPWQSNKIIGHARKNSRQRLVKGLHTLLKADMRLKNRSVNTEDILDEVVTPL